MIDDMRADDELTQDERDCLGAIEQFLGPRPHISEEEMEARIACARACVRKRKESQEAYARGRRGGHE
jgi:hypothetical protein